jgi:hypothetical protein
LALRSILSAAHAWFLRMERSMPSTNAFLPDAQLRGSLPFDAPPPQPVASPSQGRGPSYDQFGQALLRAHQRGDLKQFNALYNALGKGLASGIVIAPSGRLGARAAQAEPDFFDPSEGQEPAASPSSAPTGTESLFFDPAGGQESAAEGTVPPQFANEGMFGSGGAAMAGLESFADAATLGLAPKAAARLAAYMGGAPLGAVLNPWTADPRIAAANELAEERGEQLARAHPYASATGVLGGLVGGAVGMAPAIEKAGLGAVAGQSVRNVAKAAGLGAGMSYAESALHGGDAAENALAAAAGGVAGPIAGKVAGTVVNRVGRVSTRAWRILASKMEGVTPADLKSWYEASLSRGARPNIAAMLDAHSRGEIQGFASHNPAMRGALVDEARSAAATKGTASEEMARSAAFRQGMESLDRSSPVSLPQDLRDDPAVLDALKGYQYRGLRTRLADDKLTLDDADTLRQRLASASAKPGDEFTQARDAVTQAAEVQNPGYAKLVSDYRTASDEIAGLSHGLGGGNAANMPADLQRRIVAPTARRGLAEGQQRYQNARALAEVSGGVGKSPSDRGFENMVAGMTETAAGSHVYGLRNVARGIGGILKGEKLPRATQLQLAKALATTDPHEFHAAVERLAHAGMSLDKIRALQSAFSAYVGGSAGSVFWPDEPRQ